MTNYQKELYSITHMPQLAPTASAVGTAGGWSWMTQIGWNPALNDTSPCLTRSGRRVLCSCWVGSGIRSTGSTCNTTITHYEWLERTWQGAIDGRPIPFYCILPGSDFDLWPLLPIIAEPPITHPNQIKFSSLNVL